MASRIKIETHQIHLHLKGFPNYILDLWDLDGNGLTLNDLFLRYIEWLDLQKFADIENKRVFSFAGVEFCELDRASEFMAARFECGEYGVRNTIREVHTKEASYEKGINEAEVYPLYLLLHTPRGENMGILVLQRYGTIAMLTQFKRTFNKFLSEKHGMLSIITPYIPMNVLRGFINSGSAESITLKRVDIPSDPAERLRAGGLINRPKTISVHISGHNILDRMKMLSWLDKGSAVFVVEPLAELGLNGEHRTTVTLNVNGQNREIDFSDTGKIRPYIDIHDDDLIDSKTGHPIFDKINHIAKSYASDLLRPSNPQSES